MSTYHRKVNLINGDKYMHDLVNSRMSVLQGKKEVVVGSKIAESEREILQAICDREDRSMSYILREFAIRGLAAYFKDGQIRTTPEEDKVIAGHRPKSEVVERDHPKARIPSKIKKAS